MNFYRWTLEWEGNQKGGEINKVKQELILLDEFLTAHCSIRMEKSRKKKRKELLASLRNANQTSYFNITLPLTHIMS
jgi:hypothetical protein